MQPQQHFQAPPQQPRSNAGTIAAVLGGLAAVGGIAAAAFAGSGKKPQLRGGVRLKKPCACNGR